MLSALIIEDEINSTEVLKNLLQLITPDIKIVGETSYILEAKELIKAKKPNIIFVDIELEDGKGFEILDDIDNILNHKIIFTTAYNQYAIKAFKYSAVDYLLKPIDPEELKNAISRTISIIENQYDYKMSLSTLKDNIEKQNSKIIFNTLEEKYVIHIDNIILLEAQGAYTSIHTDNQKILMSKNIKYYEDLFTEKFIRCHQSYLVNKSHIKSVTKDNKILLSNNLSATMSARKKSQVLKTIKE